jgi:hypothetical protein
MGHLERESLSMPVGDRMTMNQIAVASRVLEF